METKAYRLFDPSASKIIVSRDVIFHERSRWALKSNEGSPMITVGDSEVKEVEDQSISSGEHVYGEAARSGDQSSRRDNGDNQNSLETSTEDSPPRRTRLLTDIYSSCTFALHVHDP